MDSYFLRCDGIVAFKRSLKLPFPVRNETVSVTEMRSHQPISDKGTEILVPRAPRSCQGRAGRTAAAQAAARQETLENNIVLY